MMLRSPKNWDDEALIPLLVGIGLLVGGSIFGLSMVGLLQGTPLDPMWWVSVLIIPSLLIVIGIIALAGKFIPVIGRPVSLIVGILTIGLGIYMLLNEGQLPFR